MFYRVMNHSCLPTEACCPQDPEQHPELKGCLSDDEVWNPSDFPEKAPEAGGLSATQYQHLKTKLLGRPILKRRLTDDQLRRQGFQTWKQYLLVYKMSNYD